MRRQPLLIGIVIVVLSIAALCGIIWANLHYTRREAGGNDFAIYWTSGRTVLFDGTTPYGVLASLKSQYLIFGLAGREGDPPSRLDLPFHIETLIMPFSLISDFKLARAFWMSFLEVALVVTVFVCLKTVQWTASPLVGAAIIFFAMFSVYGLWALILGNAVILSGLIISGTLLALRENQDELTGILLAFATFKFFTVGLLVVFILFWALFQRRRRIFFPFIMTLVILIAVSFFFFTNWFLPYFRAIYMNLRFGVWLTPGLIFKEFLPFVGARLGWILAGFLAIILLLEWWLARKFEFNKMVWVAALTLAMTPLLGFPTFPQNYIVFLIPLIIGFSFISNRWGSSSSVVITGILATLFIGLWLIAIFAVNKSVALFFPLPVFSICLLYWVRWWAIVAPRSKIEFLNPSD